jgi:hypothetical protein
MFRNLLLTAIIFIFAFQFCAGQRLIKAEELINGSGTTIDAGRVVVNQDLRIDSLLSRHIAANSKLEGIRGYRIQIYRGSHRRAREEANETKSEFISEFPEIESYLQFANPNIFKLLAGNYRTRHDAYPDLQRIKKKFPNAYIAPDIIEFPDL